MSKIARYAGNLRAFGSNAQGSERTLFGETTQADDLTSQITASFLRGWGVVGPSENPSLEDFNAAMYTMSQFIAYQHQMGIPEWDALQEYYIGSLCVRAGETYSSLADGNIGSPPQSAKWTPVLTAKNGAINLGLGGAASLNVGTTAGTVAAGDDSRIVNAISIKDTNIKLSGNLRAQGNITAQGSLIAKTNIAADGRCDIVGDVRGGRIISKSDVVAGEGRAEGHATLTVDGNIYGTLWGTDLYTYLAEQLIGIPMPYPLSSVPAGYLKCNGSAFSTSTYPRLALKYPSGVLPDMRGNVIRGWDDGRRIDAGRVLLSFQDDAIRNITGVYAPAGGKVVEASYFSGAFTRLDVPAPQGHQIIDGHAVQGAKFDASLVVPTASENRMKNIAFNYIVRAL